MFTLVIPTHNRAPILQRTLTHLFALQGISGCEVIVIDDGSTDQTSEVLKHFRQLHPHLLRVIETTNGGPGRARNYGVEAASNDRILFIDDDVFPRPGMLECHRRRLDAGYTGSQGILVWHSDITITPLIRYLDSRGAQFAFDQVEDPDHLTGAHVYTGNFAVLRSAVLKTGGFDETFFNKALGFSAFEDTILGFKLLEHGATLALNREAVADHLHDMTEEGCFHREYKVGYAIGLLRQKYPAIARSLGLDRKDFLVQSQVALLQLINSADITKKILGYSLSMRLRHREAFCRGFLLFKRDVAEKRTLAIQ